MIPTKAAEAGAIQREKDITPSGQAEIALKRAQAQEITEGRPIPFQEGGGILKAPLGGGPPTIVQPPSAKPVPMSPEERKLIVTETAELQQMDDLASLYKPQYVGPVSGRLGGLGATTGGISPEEARFRVQVAGLKNKVIAALAGANVPKDEERRMLAQIPTENDPAVVFEAKIRQSRSNLLKLAQIRRDTMAKTGANVGALPPLPKDPTDPLGIRK